MSEGHAAEAHAVDMDFYFDPDQRLQRAYGSRDIRAQTLNADSDVQLTGANVVDINFQVQGDRSVIKEMRTEGRSVATMSAPKSRANDPRAASKRLTADTIKMIWRSNGKDLEHSDPNACEHGWCEQRDRHCESFEIQGRCRRVPEVQAVSRRSRASAVIRNQSDVVSHAPECLPDYGTAY